MKFYSRKDNKMKTPVKVIGILVVALAIAVPAGAADVKRMTKEELKPMLGSADFVVVDVRRGSDWKSSGIGDVEVYQLSEEVASWR